MKNNLLVKSLFIITIFLLSGCATYEKAKRVDDLNFEMAKLRKKMDALQKEKDGEIARILSDKEKEMERLKKERDDEIAQLKKQKQKVEEKKSKELSELEKAKLQLEEKLKKEIGDYKTKLKMTERGLELTFLSEIFFDPGKDIIKEEGMSALTKVAQVLNTDVIDAKVVAVEGYTDNEPIKYSSWRSNWELSTARSLAVVHYFIDNEDVAPERLSAVGYGEFSPIASNDTPEGRQQNRRVEIIILPSNLQKIKEPLEQ